MGLSYIRIEIKVLKLAGITHTPLEQSHFNTWNKDRDYFD